MKNYLINKNILLGCCVLLLAVAACKKTGLQTDEGVTDRLFRPSIDGSLSADGNYINAAWQKITGSVSYTVQLSRDTFKTIDQSFTIDSNHITFLNLYWEKLYQVQVRANAKDSLKSSKMGSLGSIKTPKFPTILNTPGISDLTDAAVRVSWTTSGAAVSMVKILKASDSSVVTSVTLTSTDIANAYTIISGLASSTNYIIYLYSGTSVRGWANFSTKAPLAGTIIDLRNIARATVLEDTIPTIPSGSTVLLKRGMQYTIKTAIPLSKSITIISGDDLAVQSQAQIYFSSQFNFAAGAVIDNIDFKDVLLQSASYTGNYVINANANATIGRISFDGCKAEIFRGLVRIQTATISIANYSINNCIVDSIKDYAVFTASAATTKVDNISFTNSTFYKIDKLIASATAGSVSNSVSIQNCTFNEMPTSGGLLIDYGANNVTGGIQIKNCIMGMARLGGATNTVKGVKYNNTSSADGTGSYGTSDYLVTANAISNIGSYAKTAADLFTDPSNGNFKIKDNSFAGKSSAGDPRWYY